MLSLPLQLSWFSCQLSVIFLQSQLISKIESVCTCKPDWKKAGGNTGHCYMFYEASAGSWERNQLECQNKNATLPVLKTEDVHEAFRNLAAELHPGNTFPIGLKFNQNLDVNSVYKKDSSWIWDDDTKLSDVQEYKGWIEWGKPKDNLQELYVFQSPENPRTIQVGYYVHDNISEPGWKACQRPCIPGQSFEYKPPDGLANLFSVIGIVVGCLSMALWCGINLALYTERKRRSKEARMPKGKAHELDVDEGSGFFFASPLDQGQPPAAGSKKSKKNPPIPAPDPAPDPAPAPDAAAAPAQQMT